MPDILSKAERKGLVVLKIHSHPTGYEEFSSTDDESDDRLFPRISEWIGSGFAGVSAVMLPDGRVFARVHQSGTETLPVDSVLVAGPDINYWRHPSYGEQSLHAEIFKRTEQAFGKGTTQLLSQLKIGIIGVSGTGSPVVEQLYRLGVGKIVLVDGDVVKEHNLGRIINSTMNDARDRRKKVDVLSEAIGRAGLGTEVEVIQCSILSVDVLKQISTCDILFGCMDSIEGRDLLNKVSSFYCIPYFDLGVKLNADGKGGVTSIAGAVHYLQPDGSSLLSRGVYNSKKLTDEVLRRTNPEQYKQHVDEGYIKGANEDSPAVISINTLIAGFAVNDFLCRIHPSARLDDNEEIDCIRVSLTNSFVAYEKEQSVHCPFLTKYAGRGDMLPFLNMTLIEEECE
jgi:hypothetical protein